MILDRDHHTKQRLSDLREYSRKADRLTDRPYDDTDLWVLFFICALVVGSALKIAGVIQ